jgi:uncharacterized protein
MEQPPPPPRNTPIAAALFEGSLVFVALSLGWMLSLAPLATFRVTPRAVALGLAAVGPMLVLLALCVSVPRRPFSDVLGVADETLLPWFRSCNVVELAALSLLAGLGEEMLFRGIVQEYLSQYFDRALIEWAASEQWAAWLAILLTAIVFGLLHAVNWSYALMAAVVGLYLGWLWLASGNLLVPVTAHAAYDFLALVYLIKLRKPRQSVAPPADES